MGHQSLHDKLITTCHHVDGIYFHHPPNLEAIIDLFDFRIIKFEQMINMNSVTVETQ